MEIEKVGELPPAELLQPVQNLQEDYLDLDLDFDAEGLSDKLSRDLTLEEEEDILKGVPTLETLAEEVAVALKPIDAPESPVEPQKPANPEPSEATNDRPTTIADLVEPPTAQPAKTVYKIPKKRDSTETLQFHHSRQTVRRLRNARYQPPKNRKVNSKATLEERRPKNHAAARRNNKQTRLHERRKRSTVIHQQSAFAVCLAPSLRQSQRSK